MGQSGSPPAAVASGPTIDRVRQAGSIRIGYSNEFPFAFAEGDQVTGEAPEMMKSFASTIGVPAIDGVLIEWAGLIPALQAQRIDAIAAGMAIAPGALRAGTLRRARGALDRRLDRQGRQPQGHHQLEVDRRDHRTRSSGSSPARTTPSFPSYNGIPEDRVLQFPDFPVLLAAVQGGRIDAAWLDALSAKDVVKKSGDPNLEVVVPALADLPVTDLGKPSSAGEQSCSDPTKPTSATPSRRGSRAPSRAARCADREPFGFGEDQIAPVGTSVEELCKG